MTAYYLSEVQFLVPGFKFVTAFIQFSGNSQILLNLAKLVRQMEISVKDGCVYGHVFIVLANFDINFRPFPLQTNLQIMK